MLVHGALNSIFMASNEAPNPRFVGYFPKRTNNADKRLAPFGVVTVASVSNCISTPPEDWVEQWKHNDEGFYDTEELAASILPATEASRYDIYAYRLFPLRYAETVEKFEARAEAPGGVPADYEFLGYDIVSRSIADFYECSPLSCNAGASVFPVNEHCLLTRFDEAWKAFLAIGANDDGYEPGPYYFFSVYRKRRVLSTRFP